MLSQALHAYWRISDIARVAVLGLEGASGQDLLNRQRVVQQGELRPMEGCHRIFDHAGPLRLQDAGWQRRLRIDTGGSPNTVVWHPGGRPWPMSAGRKASASPASKPPPAAPAARSWRQGRRRASSCVPGWSEYLR